MKRELGIARCGLACCLCTEKADCNGCGSNGCPDNDICENKKCSIAKGLTHCYECEENCRKGLLSKIKPYAFTLMSTEQTPVFFAAPKYPAMLSKLAKGRTESYGDSARGPTWQSHEQRFPAALQ